MPRENYSRIVKVYEPREPVAFPEKVFYIWWAVMRALRILAEGAKRKALRKIEMRGT